MLRWAGRLIVGAPTAALGYATYCSFCPPKVSEISESCCVVTGASSGIGKQIVKTLADEGVTKLVIAARSKDGLEKVRKEVLMAHPSASVLVVPTDVSNPAARDNLLKQSLAHAGSMKITLVNNAGVEAMTHVDHAPTPASIKNIDRQIDINLTAVIHMTEAFLPHLTNNGGHVVNIASVAGKISVPHMSAYNASKFGCVGFTRAARYELKYKGSSASCSVICPGFVLGEGMANDMQQLVGSPKEWDHTLMVFGASQLVDTAKAVISAVNYDEPELYVNFPPSKPNVILSDLFPRLGDFTAKDPYVMGPCYKFLAMIAEKQSGN